MKDAQKETQLIGLVGTNGAGKSTVCQILKRKNFLVVSLSDYIRQELRKKGQSQTRNNLVTMANLLKKKQGQDILARSAVINISKFSQKSIVFDSIRNTSEITYLKQKGVVLWGVDASIEKRYERIQKRRRESDLIDFETFIDHDNRENTGISSGQNIHESLKACDYQLKNNGSEKDLIQEIDTLLKVLTNPQINGCHV